MACARFVAKARSAFAMLLLSACNYFLHFDQPQCSVTADCENRGLHGARCIEQLCVGSPDDSAPQVGGAAANATNAASATPATPATPATNGAHSANGATDKTSPEAQASSNQLAGSAAQMLDSGVATDASVRDAGSTPADASATASAPSQAAGSGADKNPSGPCPGRGCPECSTDADCERAGGPGGRCSNSVCYEPVLQCLQDSDCLMLGPEYDGGRCVAMQCLPSPRWRCEPDEPGTAQSIRTVKIPVIDAVSRARRPNVMVSACRSLDITCVDPVVQATSDSDGMVTLMLPGNFTGYVQQTDAPGYLPALYALPSIMPASGMLNDFPLLGSGVVADALAMSLGASMDASRGHMMLVAEDCFFAPLGAVSFSSPQQDDKTVQFYVQDQLPSTALKATTDVGQGGYLNFPPGAISLKLEQTETALELTTVSLLVRPGFITVAFIPPRAR